MTLQVRAVNLDREHDELLGVLERNLPELHFRAKLIIRAIY